MKAGRELLFKSIIQDKAHQLNGNSITKEVSPDLFPAFSQGCDYSHSDARRSKWYHPTLFPPSLSMTPEDPFYSSERHAISMNAFVWLIYLDYMDRIKLKSIGLYFLKNSKVSIK